MPSTFLGLRTTIYKVSDLTASRQWYTKAFGIEPYFDEPFYVGFNIAGYELGLLPEADSPEAKGKNVLTYWGVQDITVEYERLLSLGAQPNELPEDVGEGVMVATVIDPWDNIIGLIYNPYFKAAEM
ncbi:MAG: VOC family protein [Lewinella sp.]|nr:VOC family protein [Lewinella sp.]